MQGFGLINQILKRSMQALSMPPLGFFNQPLLGKKIQNPKSNSINSRKMEKGEMKMY